MRLGVLAVLMGLTVVGFAQAEGKAHVRKPVAIAAQPLELALQALAKASEIQLIYKTEIVRERLSPGAAGELTMLEALTRILDGTGLTFRNLDDHTVTIVPLAGQAFREKAAVSLEGNGVRVAQAEAEERAGSEAVKDEVGEKARDREEEEDEERGGIPEILVTGSRMGTLNTDIKRTKDDIQPYVVFERDVIERSGASDLHEFLKQNLTMNVVSDSVSQASSDNNRSSVSLRGLGSDETLILIDGRRAIPAAQSSSLVQADLNGIPLAAIERIEVLPTTASGIYGGGATGGVINVVLRHDYSGIEGKATYGGTFDGGGTNRRVDLSAGFSLGTKTNVMLFGSYMDSDPVLVGDRGLIQRARQHILANNPAFFFAGAPPLGATPNIRSNDVIDGVRQNLILDNGVPLNSTFTFIPAGYPGAAVDGGMALVENAGQYNFDFSHSADSGSGTQRSLLSGSEAKSVSMTLRRELSSRFEAFIELQASDNTSHFPDNFGWFADGGRNAVVIPGNAANNPFQQNIQVALPASGLDGVTVNTLETRRAVGGVIVDLPANWRSTFEYTWGQSRGAFVAAANISEATLDAMRNGSLDVLRDLTHVGVALEANPYPESASPRAATKLSDFAVRVAGPVPWALLGGTPSLSILLERRKESLDDTVRFFGLGRTLFPSRWQEVTSLYVESQIPLVSARNSLPWLRLLELQLAARRDNYSVTGATSSINLDNPRPIERFTRDDSSKNPTLGLRIQPTQDITLRASYGTGFLPPSVSQLVPIEPRVTNSSSRDPLRGDAVLGSILIDQGGNPNLEPEKSESWSAGLIITPRWIPELRLSADWSEISKTNNITRPSLSQDGLNDLIAYFPERVTRDAPSDGFDVGRISRVDLTSINMAALNVEALDLAVDYNLQTNQFGVLQFSMGATRLFSIETQATPSALLVERIGLLALSDGTGGLKWKANARVKWDYRGWSLGWRTHYFDSYFLTVDHTVLPDQGSATVPHQIYHDLFGGYRFSATSARGVLAGAEIQFGISNVFNTAPPVDLSTRFYSTLADPRLANYFVSMRKSF